MLGDLAQETPRPKQHAKAAALRFGRDATGRSGVWVVCGTCTRAEGVSLPPNAPPLAIDQQFAERLGWSIERHGVRAVCPACNRKESPVRDPIVLRDARQLITDRMGAARNLAATGCRTGGE